MLHEFHHLRRQSNLSALYGSENKEMMLFKSFFVTKTTEAAATATIAAIKVITTRPWPKPRYNPLPRSS